VDRTLVAALSTDKEKGRHGDTESKTSTVNLTFLSLERLCRNKKKTPLGVMLSGAKHLVFSVTRQDEILRLSPQDDIATQSLRGLR
jgi:hypothetical protein